MSEFFPVYWYHWLDGLVCMHPFQVNGCHRLDGVKYINSFQVYWCHSTELYVFTSPLYWCHRPESLTCIHFRFTSIYIVSPTRVLVHTSPVQWCHRPESLTCVHPFPANWYQRLFSLAQDICLSEHTHANYLVLEMYI